MNKIIIAGKILYLSSFKTCGGSLKRLIVSLKIYYRILN